jgi:hypothetical protein
MVISLGYLATAMAALLKVMAELVKIVQTQRETNVVIARMQTGDQNGDGTFQGGTITAVADAIQNSANADAWGSFFDAGNEGLQSLGSLGTIVASGQSAEDKAQINAAQAKLANTKTFGDNLNGAMPANRVLSDADKDTPLPPEVQRRYDQLLRPGELRFQDGDETVFQHAQTRAEMRDALYKRINEAEHNAKLEMNTAVSRHQTSTQVRQACVTLGQHVLSAGLTGAKGQIVYTEMKGPSEAYRALAQSSDQNVMQTASQGVQQADATAQQIQETGRIRNALGANNGTPGQ